MNSRESYTEGISVILKETEKLSCNTEMTILLCVGMRCGGSLQEALNQRNSCCCGS
ncbi:MAG: hypothetical protein KJ718_05935 [Nanoarchaeota archaeon]|nr:hypothetical protein [Nanoarchaeota archaeon]MBU1052062.1 hypothetical protein [Nanoarchaeota archaeon]